MEYITGRVDGRRENEIRSFEVEEKRDSLLLRKYTEIGRKKHYSTTLVIYSSAEIKTPSKENPKRGSLSIHSNEKTLQSLLEKIFKESQIISLDKLCIVPKKAAWSVKVDVFLVHDEGGSFDLATEGVLLSLKRLSLPEHYMSFGHNFLCTKKSLPFFLFSPRSLTISFRETSVLYDPLESEGREGAGTLKISKNEHNEIVYLLFTGSSSTRTLLEEISQSLGSL